MKDGKTIQTSIRLPEKLWEKAKLAAIRDHVSLQELIITALEAHLKGGR